MKEAEWDFQFAR